MTRKSGNQQQQTANNTTNNTGNATPVQQIIQAWQDVNGMLGRTNNIDGCDPSTQVGIFRLASAYCNRLVNDQTAWNKFLEENFSGKKLNELSSNIIAATMLDNLQAGSTLSSKQREKSLTTIVNYMQDAGDTVSKETVFDVCTMILSSASSLLN